MSTLFGSSFVFICILLLFCLVTFVLICVYGWRGATRGTDSDQRRFHQRTDDGHAGSSGYSHGFMAGSMIHSGSSSTSHDTTPHRGDHGRQGHGSHDQAQSIAGYEQTGGSGYSDDGGGSVSSGSDSGGSGSDGGGGGGGGD